MNEPTNVSRSAISRLRLDQAEARRRALGYVAAIVPPALLLALRLVQVASAVLAALCAATGAAWWLRHRLHALAAERHIADELILNGWRATAPESFDRRVAELTSVRARRALARALERQAEPVPMALPLTRTSPVGKSDRLRLQHLARRLRDAQREVDPRGLVLAQRLVSDVEGSALYRSGDAPQLDRQLAQVERLIDAA